MNCLLLICLGLSILAFCKISNPKTLCRRVSCLGLGHGLNTKTIALLLLIFINGCKENSNSTMDDLCGNGQLDDKETCDTGIAVGEGSCPTDCNDYIGCTKDTLLQPGTCFASCKNTEITDCVDDDDCCLPTCSEIDDNDCADGPGFIHGLTPSDGIIATRRHNPVILPNLLDGQRLSGTVTIEAQGNRYLKVPWRLLVNGKPQPSTTIDTTNWPDGTHVLSCQVVDTLGNDVRSGSRIVVINNSNTPWTSLKGQAITARQYASSKPNSSLAWGRVDVRQPEAYPLDPQLDMHPVAKTDADRNRLATEKIWWVEGINHIPTPLWKTLPILMKNRDGDYFVKNFNPQGGGSGVKAELALPYVERAPTYDGPRGIGIVSPYTTFTADRHIVLASGQTGWLGVQKDGRVVRMDIDGSLTTILGPRSVAGVVGTDSDDSSVGLAERIERGEKEYIGDDNGLPLKLSHDIWVCDSFPFEGVIADTSNDRIAEIHFEEQRLMRSWPIPGVTSVWGSFRAQQELRIAWFAVNPEGLWAQVIKVNGQGIPIGHGTVSKLIDIPNAFWVRVVDLRVFVMTLAREIYEYDPITHALVLRRERDREFLDTFVFMAIDEFGSIGPKHRIYWSSAKDKTSIHWLDTTDWSQGGLSKEKLINRNPYTNWTADTDPFGHYMWGFSPHATLPKMISAGITSSSWFLWTGCLGQLPTPDPKLSYDGATEAWRSGVLDRYIPPATVWGYHGHGQIGYSADQFRDYETWSEARQTVFEALEPFFWPQLTEDEREQIARKLFTQRTRKRF